MRRPTPVQIIALCLLTVLTVFGYTNCSGGFAVMLDFSSEGLQRSNSFTSLKCADPNLVSATEMRRLTKTELTNTLSDLLGSTVATSLLPTLARLPDDKDTADSFSNSYSDLHLSALSDLAASAAQLMTQAGPLGIALSRYTTCTTTATMTDVCATDFISKFGLRALRRPLSQTEITTFKDLYDGGTTPQEGFQVVVMTMLQSPEFLYHVELGTPAIGTDTAYDVTSFEMASRISYALWNTMPTQELFDAAASGVIRDPAQLESLVDRMIEDTRTKTKMKTFFSAWLGLRSLPNPSPNPDFLNGLVTTGLTAEMSRELDQYLDYIVWKKRAGYEELMTSKVSFARTPALAAIYEHPLATDPNAATQTMGPGRMGLLLRSPLLMAGDDENHPILRGVTLRKNVLCDVLGMPSNEAFAARPDVDTTAYILGHTVRQRVAEKTSASNCIGCHAMINPIGFALEEFDPLGRRRTTEKAYDSTFQFIVEHRVDSSARDLLIDVGGPDASTSGEQLIDIIAHSDKGSACFARQTYRYFAFRQENTVQDGCSLKGIRDAVVGDGGSITDGLKRVLLNPGLAKKVVKAN